MITQQPPYIAGTVLTHITFSGVRTTQHHQGIPSTSLVLATTLLGKDLLKLLQRGGVELSNTTESWKIIVWKELEEKLSSLVV